MKLFRSIKKLRTKLLIIFTVQVFLLLGIALSVSFFLARSSNHKNLDLLNRQLKTLADTDFQNIFDEIDRAYLSIVTSSNFSTLYNARSDSNPLEIYELYYDVDDLLTAPLTSSQYIHSINYLTPDNKILISSIAGELSMERNFSIDNSPEWFQLHTRLLNTVGSLSETYIPPHQELYYQRTSSSANQTVVSIVRKTASFNTNYKNRGLLYFNVELSDFVALTDSLSLYPDMETVILTDTGRVIHDSSESITECTDCIETLRNCTSEQSLTLNGQKYMTVPVTMKDSGWNIYTLIPWQVYTADIRDYTVYSLAFGLIVFIAGFIMTWIMSARVSAPVENLSHTMKSVRNGNIQQRADIISSDEIGELSNTFNTMLDQINRLIEQEYQLKVKQQDAQMKALQAQINPHFLYNSLSIINWKALEAGEEDISRVTLALSTYYRTSLNRGETMTTVENEISNIRAYLKIQLIMHDDSFSVQENINEDTLTYEIPKLILQPLVENAIDHGLDLSEKEEKNLQITVEQDEDYLIFAVADDGIGMEQEKAEQILTYQSPGYGVRNVCERIQVLYGKEGLMAMESSPGQGTKVTIRIPKKAGKKVQ